MKILENYLFKALQGIKMGIFKPKAYFRMGGKIMLSS